MCPVCSSNNFKKIRNYRSDKSIFQEMSLVECESCGMIYADPMPSDSVLNEYNARYFEEAHGGIAEDIIAKSFFSGIAWVRMKHIHDFIDQHKLKVNSILEIGPGTGYLAGNWLKLHPENKYSAVETDASCHPSLIQMGINIESIDDLLKSGKRFDLIILSHVVEHVSRPKELLKLMYGFLNANGVIFIEVPCRDWDHKNADEPHLLFFEKAPMKKLLESLNFQKIKLSYHGKTLNELKSSNKWQQVISKIQTKLNQFGFTKLTTIFYTGTKQNMTSIEIASVMPFKPHIESDEYAWWLRAIAIK